MTRTHTVAFSKDSTNLFFHILTKCNLKCRHCYINPDQHGKNTLPLTTIKSWLEIFSRNSNAKNLIFLGGEPTLHPDLAAAVKYARHLGFGSLTIDTNGYLFGDILSKVTPAEVDYFSFSLDGATRETNDRIRGEGSFDTCLDGIREANSRGFATSMIYTVSSSNIHELENVSVEPRFFTGPAKQFFVGSRRAGGDDHPVQSKFLYVVLDGRQAGVGTGVQIVSGIGYQR